MLELNRIRIDGGTQSRAALNQDTVAEYAEAYLAGASLPAVTVFYDGSDYWLADGFHRYFAVKQAGHAQIFEDVIPGTKRDAVLYSLGANAKHGLRRTNEDKRRAVLTLLNDPEWAKWSDREIAKQCGVSHDFASRSRRSMSSDDSDMPAERTYNNKHGQTATMNTASIGKRVAPPVDKSSISGNVTGLETVADRTTASGSVSLGEISVPKAHEQIAAPKAAPSQPHQPAAHAECPRREKPVLSQNETLLIQELDELRDASDALRERNEELEAENKTLLTAADPLVLKRLQDLEAFIKVVESQRNDFQNQCAELKKQVKRLQRELDRAKVDA